MHELDFKCTFSWTDHNSTQLSFADVVVFFFFQINVVMFLFLLLCRVAWICYMLFFFQSSEYWHDFNLVGFALSLMHWMKLKCKVPEGDSCAT